MRTPDLDGTNQTWYLLDRRPAPLRPPALLVPAPAPAGHVVAGEGRRCAREEVGEARLLHEAGVVRSDERHEEVELRVVDRREQVVHRLEVEQQPRHDGLGNAGKPGTASLRASDTYCICF